MARVYLIGGEKGGTGKSFVCRTLIQYFMDAKIPFAAVDADSSNPDVKDIYSGLVTEVRFSEDDFRNNPYEIYTLAIEKPVVVNLPAGVYEPLKDWIVTADVASSASEDGVSFCHFLVSSGMYDSLLSCIKVLETMGAVMPHIFVKNKGAGRDWEFYKTFEFFKEAIEKYKVAEIEFPDLQAPVVNKILQSRLTYSQYLESENTAAGMKPLVRNFLRKAYAAFESTGLMPRAEVPISPEQSIPTEAETNGNSTKTEQTNNNEVAISPEQSIPTEAETNGNSTKTEQTNNNEVAISPKQPISPEQPIPTEAETNGNSIKTEQANDNEVSISPEQPIPTEIETSGNSIKTERANDNEVSISPEQPIPTEIETSGNSIKTEQANDNEVSISPEQPIPTEIETSGNSIKTEQANDNEVSISPEQPIPTEIETSGNSTKTERANNHNGKRKRQTANK